MKKYTVPTKTGYTIEFTDKVRIIENNGINCPIGQMRFVSSNEGRVNLYFACPIEQRDGWNMLGIKGYYGEVGEGAGECASKIRGFARDVMDVPDDGEDAGMVLRRNELHIARYEVEDEMGPQTMYVTNSTIYFVKDGWHLVKEVNYSQIKSVKQAPGCIRLEYVIPMIHAKSQEQKSLLVISWYNCDTYAATVISGIHKAVLQEIIASGPVRGKE